MGRLARSVFAGLAHHVTQRGNGRAQTFFDEGDDLAYREMMAEQAAATGLETKCWPSG